MNYLIKLELKTHFFLDASRLYVFANTGYVHKSACGIQSGLQCGNQQSHALHSVYKFRHVWLQSVHDQSNDRNRRKNG